MILLGKLIKGSPNCYSEPYMPVSELEEEMQKMQFYGYYVGKKFVGVVGLQNLPEHDVFLIRHLYVLRILAQRHRKYWKIPERRVEESVVLRYNPKAKFLIHGKLQLS